MGRSFESVRMGAKDISARWTKAAQAMKKEDQIYALKLLDMAWSKVAFVFLVRSMEDDIPCMVHTLPREPQPSLRK